MYMFRIFDQAAPATPIDARMVAGGVVRVGRGAGSDWVIPDPDCEISRVHCELVAEAGGLRVRSLGANGIVDEATSARLPEGDAVPLSLPGALRMGRFRLVAERAGEAAGDPDATSATMMFADPIGRTDVPADWTDRASVVAPMREGSLLEAFCEGAGLDASVFSAEEPTEVMRRAGAVYRQMVLGVGDLVSERDAARSQYALNRTTIGGSHNNPFKWAPTQRLAIDLLLTGERRGFLTGPEALKESLGEVKRHLVATFAGLKASLSAAVGTFDPAAVEAAAGEKTSLLKGRAALAWEEAQRRHAELRRQLDESGDGSLNQAFVKAYARVDEQGK